MGSTSQRRDNPVGFDYVHSLVDDHSRLAYSEIVADEKGTTCAAFLARAIEHFAAHGINRVALNDQQPALERGAGITLGHESLQGGVGP